jgi:hypothetical protein
LTDSDGICPFVSFFIRFETFSRKLFCRASFSFPWRAARMLNPVLTKELLTKLGYSSMLDQYLKVCENL